MSLSLTTILVADDDLDDQELLEEAFLLINEKASIHTVSSGKEVLVYLQNCSILELPCLVVLDYNMPDFTGPEILETILKEDRYKKIPSVIWSTSNTNLYKEISIQRGAKQYYQKPQNFKGIITLAQEMLRICNQG